MHTCGNLGSINEKTNQGLEGHKDYGLFHTNGRIVHLCSDPLGWYSDSDSDLGGKGHANDIVIRSNHRISSIG